LCVLNFIRTFIVETSKMEMWIKADYHNLHSRIMISFHIMNGTSNKK